MSVCTGVSFSLLIKLSISSSAQSHSFDQKSPLLIKIIFKVDYFPLNRNEIFSFFESPQNPWWHFPITWDSSTRDFQILRTPSKRSRKKSSYLSCERITEHHNFVKVIKLGKVFLHHISNLISLVDWSRILQGLARPLQLMFYLFLVWPKFNYCVWMRANDDIQMFTVSRRRCQGVRTVFV